MIEVVRVDGRPINKNTGSFINKGFEFEASYRPHYQFRFDLNYSYLNTSRPIIAAPKHKLIVNGSFSPGRFNINLNTTYIGSLYVNTSNQIVENYLLLNSRISYKWGSAKRGVTLFVKGENLTGAKYSINEGFPMPGFTAMVGADFNI
jgi:iron complex outermembrane receptor protein